MSAVTTEPRSVRKLAVFVCGLLFAALAITQVAAASTRPAITRAAVSERIMSCPALSFTSWGPDNRFDYDPARGYIARVGAGSVGYVYCSLELPNKATVTRFRMTTRYIGTGTPNECALVRSSLIPASAGTLQVIANLPPNYNIDNMPGGIGRVSTSSVATPFVNNVSYGYFARCLLTTLESYFYGVDVTYSISAENG